LSAAQFSGYRRQHGSFHRGRIPRRTPPGSPRAALSAVRKTINENLPDGYEEGMQFGMIGWYVPLSLYPAGYGENPKVPLPVVALASQKSGMVLHFLCFSGHPTLSTWFTSEYKKTARSSTWAKARLH
jgi:hypothetical protein